MLKNIVNLISVIFSLLLYKIIDIEKDCKIGFCHIKLIFNQLYQRNVYYKIYYCTLTQIFLMLLYYKINLTSLIIIEMQSQSLHGE